MRDFLHKEPLLKKRDDQHRINVGIEIKQRIEILRRRGVEAGTNTESPLLNKSNPEVLTMMGDVESIRFDNSSEFKQTNMG